MACTRFNVYFPRCAGDYVLCCSGNPGFPRQTQLSPHPQKNTSEAKQPISTTFRQTMPPRRKLGLDFIDIPCSIFFPSTESSSGCFWDGVANFSRNAKPRNLIGNPMTAIYRWTDWMLPDIHMVCLHWLADLRGSSGNLWLCGHPSVSGLSLVSVRYHL